MRKGFLNVSDDDEADPELQQVSELPEMQRLYNWTALMMGVNQARVILKKMKTTKMQPTMDSLYEIDGLIGTFVMSYGRAFTSAGRNRLVLKPNQVFGENSDILPVHEEIMHMRDRKYAHNDDNDHTDFAIVLDRDGDDIVIVPQVVLGIPGDAFDLYEEALATLEKYIFAKVFGLLEKASEKTGKTVRFPTGPVPPWAQ